MKKISFAFFLLFCFFPGFLKLSAACPPRTVIRSYGTTKSQASTSRNSKSFKARKIEALRKKERYTLNELQRLQGQLFLRRDKLSAKQKAKYGEQLQKRLDEFQKTAFIVRDFPFADKLNNIGSVVLDIQAGKIKFENCAGKKEQYILRKIWQAQFNALYRSYNYREID